jgi:Ca2+-binding RTX toxin-like protein
MRAVFAEIEVLAEPTTTEEQPLQIATPTGTAVVSEIFDVADLAPTAGMAAAGDITVGIDDPMLSDGWEFTVDLNDLAISDGFEPLFLVGTSGNDVLTGDWTNDLIIGGDGSDYLFGRAGDDTLIGQNGDDFLYGGDGADWLIGDSGRDVLLGEAGDDVLVGGAGDDTLEGGSGIDVMIGGQGKDTFMVAVNARYANGDWQILAPDTITDFDTDDVIDLSSALDEHPTFTGHNVSDAFSQGYILLKQHGNPGEEGFGTTVYLDNNGAALGGVEHYALVDIAAVSPNQLSAYDFTF